MVAKWFQYYKCGYRNDLDTTDGYINNKNAVRISECLSVEIAIKVIQECHHAYKSIKKVQLFHTSITTDSRPQPASKRELLELELEGGYRRKYSRNKKRNQKSRGRSKKRQQRRK